MQNATFTQQQQQMFVAQVQQDTNMHGMEVRSSMMLAWTDTGCVYSDGKNVLRVEGEAASGEVYMGEVYVGEYSTNAQWLKLHLDGGHLCYENNEDGWAEMAGDVLRGEHTTMDLC
jgi:hypothetical protein